MLQFPIDSKTFRSEVFERRPFLARQSFKDDSASWSLLDDALVHTDPNENFLKLIKRGREDQSSFTEEYTDIGVKRRRIRKDVLYAKMRDGASLVLNRFDLVSSRVSDICMEIGRFVGAQASANGYASFGGEPATNIHWDTHDVFVVQVKGRKHWQVFEPTHPLPISGQISNERRDEAPPVPALEAVIEAGDILYVPRGWWHRVSPIADTETLHLTVAIHAPLVLDYLIWACANKLPSHLPVRRALAALDDDADRIASACEVVAQTLRDPRVLEEFYARSRSRERVVTPFNIEALVKETSDLFEDGARVTVNSRYPMVGLQPVINGRVVSLTAEQRRVLDLFDHAYQLDYGVLRAQLGWPPEIVERVVRELVLGDVLAVRPALSSGPSDRVSEVTMEDRADTRALVSDSIA